MNVPPQYRAAAVASPHRPDIDFERFLGVLLERHAGLPAPLARRLARADGSRVDRLLGSVACLADLGPEVAPGLHAGELGHLQREAWAATGDDMLWRRSKPGLHLGPADRERIASWMSAPAVPEVLE